MIYEAVNRPVLDLIPHCSKRLLDVGCGTGALGQEIKKLYSCEVVGVTCSRDEARHAEKRIDKVVIQDLNNLDLNGLGIFDCIICSHILEHLTRPENLLNQLCNNLHPDGVLLVALPNPVFWRQRLEFLRGKFRYTKGGIMDETHYRFFDWKTSQELLTKNGFKIIEREGDGGFPLSRYFLSTGRLLDRVVLKAFPGFFSTHFIFTCRLEGR